MPAGRRDAHRTRMRARLLSAALRLFAERGYEPTTIDQIAEAADVARQTVLNHYPHKRDFLQAWGQDRRDQLLELADPARPGESARGQLQRYFAALAQMNEREPELTRTLYLSLRHDEVLAYQRPVPEAVLAAIRRGQARGELDPAADPSAAAEVLTAVYFDTLTRWLTQEGAPSAPSAPSDLSDLSAELAGKLDLVLTGLTAR